MIADRDMQVYVSAVSAYEMSYKHNRGRWSEIAPLVAAFEAVAVAEGFSLLPLSAEHAIRAGAYGPEHRDPFDRMIVAQAVVEDMVLLSKDKALLEMGARRVWGV